MKNEFILKIKMLFAASVIDRKGGRGIRRSFRTAKKYRIKTPDLSKACRGAKKLLKKMKKMSFLPVLALVLVLSGCSAAHGYSEPEEVNTVAALGFDASDGAVTVSAQTVGGDGEKKELLVGKGESVHYALSHLLGGETKKTELSHCALIVLGEGVDGGLFSEILEFCRHQPDITDAVLFVSAYNAEALLDSESGGGYDIVNAMKSSSDGAGMFSRNRYYEIKSSQRLSEGERVSAVALPYFYIFEDSVGVFGLKVYRDLEGAVILDRRESVLYLMMRGIFSGGVLDYDNGEAMSSVGVKRSRTTYDISGEELRISCTASIDEELSKSALETVERVTERGMEELYEDLVGRYGDVFELWRVLDDIGNDGGNISEMKVTAEFSIEKT